MIPVSPIDALILADLLHELEDELAASDPEFVRTIQVEIDTVRGILRRRTVLAEDTPVLEDLRLFAWEVYTTLEEEFAEDGIDLADLELDDPELVRHDEQEVLCQLLAGYLAVLGCSRKAEA